MQAFSIVLTALALVHVRVQGYEDDAHTPAQYQFEYGVSSPLTGDIKAQREERKGQLVNGEYALRESDGTTRLVQYKSGPQSGFEAVVQRAGVAQHPALGFGGQGFGGQAFGGQTFGGQGLGGHAYLSKAYGGVKYGGVGQGLGGQRFVGQGIGGFVGGLGGFGGLGGGIGSSFVGGTVWKNQGAAHDFGGHGHGLLYKHGY